MPRLEPKGEAKQFDKGSVFLINLNPCKVSLICHPLSPEAAGKPGTFPDFSDLGYNHQNPHTPATQTHVTIKPSTKPSLHWTPTNLSLFNQAQTLSPYIWTQALSPYIQAQTLLLSFPFLNRRKGGWVLQLLLHYCLIKKHPWPAPNWSLWGKLVKMTRGCVFRCISIHAI